MSESRYHERSGGHLTSWSKKFYNAMEQGADPSAALPPAVADKVASIKSRGDQIRGGPQKRRALFRESSLFGNTPAPTRAAVARSTTVRPKSATVRCKSATPKRAGGASPVALKKNASGLGCGTKRLPIRERPRSAGFSRATDKGGVGRYDLTPCDKPHIPTVYFAHSSKQWKGSSNGAPQGDPYTESLDESAHWTKGCKISQSRREMHPSKEESKVERCYMPPSFVDKGRGVKIGVNPVGLSQAEAPGPGHYKLGQQDAWHPQGGDFSLLPRFKGERPFQRPHSHSQDFIQKNVNTAANSALEASSRRATLVSHRDQRIQRAAQHKKAEEDARSAKEMERLRAQSFPEHIDKFCHLWQSLLVHQQVVSHLALPMLEHRTAWTRLFSGRKIAKHVHAWFLRRRLQKLKNRFPGITFTFYFGAKCQLRKVRKQRAVRATEVLMQFIKQCAPRHQSVMAIRKYIDKVRYCQRMWRSVQAKTAASIRVLELKWLKAEEKVMKTLREKHEQSGISTAKLKRAACNSDFQVDADFLEMVDRRFFPDKIREETRARVLKNGVRRAYHEVHVPKLLAVAKEQQRWLREERSKRGLEMARALIRGGEKWLSDFDDDVILKFCKIRPPRFTVHSISDKGIAALIEEGVQLETQHYVDS